MSIKLTFAENDGTENIFDLTEENNDVELNIQEHAFRFNWHDHFEVEGKENICIKLQVTRELEKTWFLEYFEKLYSENQDKRVCEILARIIEQIKRNEDSSKTNDVRPSTDDTWKSIKIILEALASKGRTQ